MGLAEPPWQRSFSNSLSSGAKLRRGEPTCLEMSAVRNRASGRVMHR